MTCEEKEHTIEVRVFGKLRRYMDDRGLPYALGSSTGPDGSTAYALAIDLGIPPEEIEAVFRNGRVQNIYDRVLPGDRVAFLPYGTPGPYRAFLGIWRENRKRKAIEDTRIKEESCNE